MEGNLTTVATRFVDLALKHGWPAVTELAPDEVRVFLDTVLAAGFEATNVVPGKLRGHYREQDGSTTGETFPVNDLCPYKVVNDEGRDNHGATGWLDTLLRYAVNGNGDRSARIEAIVLKIEESIPLEPVQLTADGALLREYPPSVGNRHTRDDHALDSCVGVHKYCDGWMDRRRATEQHDALICRACHLRVVFPRTIRTYGELREYLAAQFARASA